MNLFAKRMNSLRLRLLLGVLAAIALFWAAWFGCQVVQMSRQETGLWDQTMQSIGQQILLSLPKGLDQLDERAVYSLPAQVRVQREHVSYQVWQRDGRAVLRSADAPATPWLPLNFDADDAFARVQADGDEWRVYAISDASGQMQVQVAKSRRQMKAMGGSWLALGVGTVLLLMLVLSAVIWLIIRWSLRPVQAVRAAIVQRSALAFQPVCGDDLPEELRPLVDAFNKLLARLEAALQAERRFLADAAHELRTPLAALMAQAQLAQSAPSWGQSRAALEPLVEGIARSARLTEQMLDLARLDAAETQPAPGAAALHEIVALVVHDFDAIARQGRQRLLLHTEPCSVAVDVDTLGVLLRNLVDNALRYAGAGARVEVACAVERGRGAGRVLLSVRDDGPGVPAAERGRIFDRFYRVAGTAGRGSGIGLSLVARIAELHGAELEVTDGLDGRGFGITLRFNSLGTVSSAERGAAQSGTEPAPAPSRPALGAHAANPAGSGPGTRLP